MFEAGAGDETDVVAQLIMFCPGSSTTFRGSHGRELVLASARNSCFPGPGSSAGGLPGGTAAGLTIGGRGGGGLSRQPSRWEEEKSFEMSELISSSIGSILFEQPPRDPSSRVEILLFLASSSLTPEQSSRSPSLALQNSSSSLSSSFFSFRWS